MLNVLRHLPRGVIELAVAIILAIAAERVGHYYSRNEPRLVIDINSSTVAGRSITDFEIENGGSVALSRLQAELIFNSKVEYSVEPTEYSSCAKIASDAFSLRCPEGLKLEPSQALRVRFISTGEHSVRNREGLPSNVFATANYPPLAAVWRKSGLLGDFMNRQTMVGVLFTLVVVFGTAFFVLLYRVFQQRKTKVSNPEVTAPRQESE